MKKTKHILRTTSTVKKSRGVIFLRNHQISLASKKNVSTLEETCQFQQRPLLLTSPIFWWLGEMALMNILITPRYKGSRDPKYRRYVLQPFNRAWLSNKFHATKILLSIVHQIVSRGLWFSVPPYNLTFYRYNQLLLKELRGLWGPLPQRPLL